MKNLVTIAKNLIVKKFALWIFGLLGLSGLGILFLIVVLILLLVGIVGGSSSSTASSSSVGSYCATTGEVSQENWDKVFSNAGKLSDAKDDIISISKEQGIDPVLFAAISLHETGFGKSNAIANKNNPGGLMGAGGLMSFSSLKEGLEAMGTTLHNRIIVDGLDTIDKLGSVYAPLGAANDPNNLNANWVPNITDIVKSLGGLTMNCEATEGEMPTINFDGNTSDLRKNIIKTGTKWIGQKYYWGGGRTISDIKKGHFDCSSFVRWAFAENGIDLGPMGSTSTETLKNKGKAINIKHAKPGDIVFFDTYKKNGHVVIYIGDGKFIGCNGDNTSGGVSIESMSSPYWKSVFSGHVRRVIND